jgi:hypothetical protein
MNNALRSWLRTDDEPVADRDRQVGRIMGGVDETRQRRRLWPPNPFGRRAVHSAAGSDGSAPVTDRTTAALVPARVTTVLALVLVVAVGLVWLTASRGNSRPPRARW